LFERQPPLRKIERKRSTLQQAYPVMMFNESQPAFEDISSRRLNTAPTSIGRATPKFDVALANIRANLRSID
jgi:hypothetical protein